MSCCDNEWFDGLCHEDIIDDDFCNCKDDDFSHWDDDPCNCEEDGFCDCWNDDSCNWDNDDDDDSCNCEENGFCDCWNDDSCNWDDNDDDDDEYNNICQCKCKCRCREFCIVNCINVFDHCCGRPVFDTRDCRCWCR